MALVNKTGLPLIIMNYRVFCKLIWLFKLNYNIFGHGVHIFLQCTGGTKDDGPSLYSVVGPGGQFFGYLYMLPSNPEIKVVNDKTLWIGNLSERRDEKMGAS